jgi:hypothetical protein
MRFEFIDNNSLVNSAVRQRVRKHAATGKNAGRKLSRPSKKKSGCAKPATQAMAAINEPLLHRGLQSSDKTADLDEGSGELGSNKLERQIDDGLTFVFVPTNESLTLRSKSIVQRSMYYNGLPPTGMTLTESFKCFD